MSELGNWKSTTDLENWMRTVPVDKPVEATAFNPTASSEAQARAIIQATPAMIGTEQPVSELDEIQATFKQREFGLWIPEPSEFPELIITIPDDVEDANGQIQLAPLYDVHFGSPEQDTPLLYEHLDWMANTPGVYTWDGGDTIENKTPNEGHMGHDPMSPEEQVMLATRKEGLVRHKMFFKLPGNHEDRTSKQSWISSARMIANNLKVPFFPDYCFCTIKWRGNNFRLIAHHGAGGAQTPGAQRNAARKELEWAKPDMLWTGHLHQPLVDPVFITDVDQSTGRYFERDVLVIISPSYVKYFGGYSAHSRMKPGTRGLTVVMLNESGRIDANVHAHGRRL
jgi:hypothetical protein